MKTLLILLCLLQFLTITTIAQSKLYVCLGEELPPMIGEDPWGKISTIQPHMKTAPFLFVDKQKKIAIGVYPPNFNSWSGAYSNKIYKLRDTLSILDSAGVLMLKLKKMLHDNFLIKKRQVLFLFFHKLKQTWHNDRNHQK